MGKDRGADAGKKLVSLWTKRGHGEEALRAAEAVISGWHPQGFEGYIADLTPEGGEGSTCTSVWTAGTIAYRCRTCQTSDSSAICITCFKDGGHELHDYVLYRSEAGGCCDCGDPVSWKPSGCCPAHAPSSANPPGAAPPSSSSSVAAMPPELRAQGALVLRLVLEQLLAAARQGGEDKEALAARLLQWLQVACNAPAIRALVCEQLLDPTGGAAMSHCTEERAGLCRAVLAGCEAAGAWRGEAAAGSGHVGAGSILDTLLGMFSSLAGDVMEVATTVLLILLYNHDFKYQFTCLLLRHYAALVLAPYDERRAQVQNVATCLDRLTVQLFNVPAVTLQLVREERLLDTFMSLLSRILQRTCTAHDGRINPESTVIEDKMYSRVLGDLRMVVSHREVVSHLLTERHDLLCRLLAVLAPMQGMHPYTLQRGDHVEHEPATWTHAVTLEVHLLAILSIMLAPPDEAAGSPGGGGGGGGGGAGGALERNVLSRGGSITLDFAATWVKGHRISTRPPAEAWAGLCAAEPVSLHLPLHRAVGSFLGALLAADVAAGGAGPAGPLGGVLVGQDAREHMASLLDELLRVAAWLAQIRARMWVRNGEHMFRLERVYRSSYWHEYGLDLDTVVMQQCFASAADPGAVLQQVVHAFGGQALLDSAARGRAASAMDAQELCCLADMVALVATLVRERQAAGMAPRDCLRRELVHWLCYSDHTHTQLSSALPAGLAARADLDAVLAEVSDFSQPKLQDRGKYAVKKDEWQNFDPFFLHYSRADLEEAMGRAQASGVYKMEWVLRPPARGPPSVERAYNVVHDPTCHRLVWGALAYGLANPSTSADDLCMGAIQLLALALGDPRAADEGNPRAAAAARRRAAGAAALLGGDPPRPFSEPDVVEACEQVPANGNLSIKDMLQKLSSSGPWSPGGGSGGGCGEGESGVRACAKSVLSMLRKARAESAPTATAGAGSSEDPGPFESREKAEADARKKAARERQAAIMRDFSQKQATFLEGADDMMSSDEDEDEREEAGAGEGEASGEGRDVLSPRGRGKDCALCRGQAGGHVGLGWIALVQASKMPHTAAHPAESDALLRALDGGAGGGGVASPRVLSPSKSPAVSPASSRRGAEGASFPASPPAPPSPARSMEGVAVGGAAGEPEGGGGEEEGGDKLYAAPPTLDTCLGLHAQVCGHKVHHECFVRYVDSLMQSQKSGRPFEGMHVVTLENSEFLCPTCRRLGNAVLPDLAVPPPCHSGFLVRPDPDAHGALKHSDSEVAMLGRAESLGSQELHIRKAGSAGELKRTGSERGSGGGEGMLPERWQVAGGVDSALEAARGALCSGEPLPRPRHAPVTDAFVRQCRRVLIAARRDALRGSPGPAQLASAESILWGALAHSVAHCEVAARAPAVAAAPASPGEAFSWRASVALGRLLLSPESPAGGALLPLERRAAAIAWLSGDPGAEGAASAPPAVLTVLPPLPAPGGGARAAEAPTMGALLAADLPTLLLELLAAAPCRGRRGQPGGLEDGFRAILRLLYLVGVTQAAVECVVEAGAASRAAAEAAAEAAGAAAAAPAGAEACGSPMRVDAAGKGEGGGGGEGGGVILSVLGEAMSLQGTPERWAAMEEAIGSRLMVLLRRAAVLAAALEGSDTAPQLSAHGSADQLAAALGLPPVASALSACFAAESRDGGGGARVLRWCAHLLHPAWEHMQRGGGGGAGAGGGGGVPRPVALRPPALLQLPGLFQELYIRWSDQPCSRCRQIPQEPALCLVCGALLCCAGECCRSSSSATFGAGECYRHVATCGGGFGVLLLVKATRVLLLRDRRACVGPSLYLDQHGEEDWYLKRGRPLHLSRLRYEELSRLWVTGAFDFDTHTLHHSRGGPGHLGAEWY